MGFLTRLLAGLTAAAALGAGLTGTANAVDVTGATGTTKSVVKLTADDTNNLPDHLVNGDFSVNYHDQWKDSFGGWTSIDPNAGKTLHATNYVDSSGTWKWTAINGWDRSKFGWTSTQKAGSNVQQKANAVELQYDDSTADNVYAELCAYEAGTAIYQDIRTTPGTLYKVRLKHASLNQSYLDKMQVMIGAPGHEQPVEMTRTSVNGHGDKLNEKSTTIATKVTNGNNRHHADQWETYEGTYLIPDGQTTTRFTFRSVDSKQLDYGNVLDDIVFDKAYRLSYDKNSTAAAGEVPSNQRGKENTVQPARTKTSGTVRTAADTDAADGSQQTEAQSSTDQGRAASTASNLPDHLVNGDFNVNYKDQWLTGGWNWTDITPDGKYLNSTRNWNDSDAVWKNINGWDRNAFGWSSTQKDGTDNIQHKAGAVEVQYDDLADNVYAELCAYEAGTAIYQDIKTVPGTLYKVRLKHASLYDGYLDKMQVMIGAPGHEQPVEMTRTGVNGNGDKLNEKSNIIATKVSNTGENDRNHDSQWESYEGTYLIPAGQTVTRFTFRSVGSRNLDHGNLLDDIVFDKAYKLTYDKNASDATGKVPSDETAGTVRQIKARTTGTVRLASDDKNGLPDHLVNGDFEYPGANVLSKNPYNWWGVSRKDKMVYYLSHETQWVSLPSTFDSDRFAWDSTEVAGVQNGSSQWHTNEVELQQDSRTGNMYAELCAYQAHTSIRQYIHTTPGTLYKVRLKHASLSRDYLDKMQVLVGPAGNEQPVRMTRVESQNGLDATGESTASTTISTHASNEMEIKDGQDGQGTPYSSRNHNGQWATYEGVYVATSDVTSFTFKSVDAKAYNLGNLLDDIVFDKAYRLSYDKNATDANGSVPSDETAGTVKRAKAGTTGALRLASDDDVATYAASNLPKQLVNSDFDHDWRNIVSQSKMSAKYNFANIDPAHGDVEISGALNSKGEASKHWVHLNGFDAARFGWKSNQTDTRVDGRGGIVEIQRSKANDNMYAEITASQANTYLYQDIDTAHDYPTVYTVKLRYAHRNGTINSNEKIQILVGAPGHEQPVEMTRIASDRGNRLGEKSTTVNAPNTDGWLGSWDTFQGSVVVPAGRNVSRFTFKALGSIDGISGNLIDDVQFKLAYKLSYDKNSQDAFGQVPSDETANTVKQAKTRTTGTVRAVADRTASGLTVHDLKKGDIAPAQYGDFKFSTTDGVTADQITDVNGFTVKTNWDPTKEDQAYADKSLDATGSIPSDTAANTTQPAKSETDGKVSDLVQRTTTHEDGSVTVKTIDTSTDVVSGCQVYYPAGQKITLATMAKDDDCWDSSMLSRPGHTQLGWNQDRNATQAQAEVTMVEGGMAVYAVWVGNPVLTYDTNKPSTWSGQMPSTPASVSVAYNTPAADGSGWRAGDTSKIRGYRFLGWYTGPQDNAGLYDWTRPLTGNVTVYAHWQRLQANVVYNANGGTGSHANTTGWQYSDVTIPGDTSKSFKHDGLYRFKHWNTQPNDQGTVYTDGSRIALQDKDITLYAIWVPYHENFVPTGGIGLPIAIAGGVLLLMFGIGSTVMLTRRMNGHGMPDDE